MLAILAGTLASSGLLARARSAERCAPWSEAFLARESLVVGKISIRAGDLFDTERVGQDRAIHSVANALHLATRERTVRSALILAAGDPFSLAALAEAERALRARRYLREAEVRPRRVCGTRVDLDVRTVDNWTLTPSVSFGSAGGVSRYGVELQDLNLLGLGKELTFRLKEAGDEREATFLYEDDNLRGGRHRLSIGIGDTESGRQYAIGGGLPFYSSVTPLSWWLSADGAEDAFGVPDIDPSPGRDEGSLATEARVSSDRSEGRIVLQDTIGHGVIRHRGLGLRHESQRTTLPTFPDVASHDFEELYPFASVTWFRPDWSERRDYRGIGTVEDVDLGPHLTAEAGLLVDGLGGDRRGVRIALAAGRGWQPTPRSLHRLELGLTYHVDGSPSAKHAGSLRYQHFRWLGERDQFDLQLVLERQRGYTRASDFRLGGQYGLKGYPNDYARGETRAVGLVEFRHVTGWTPFELTHAAFTAFAEVGRIGTHADGTGDGDRAGDTLADIGIGLTLAPTRSSRHATFRFDIAVPLVGGEDVDAFQLFAGTQIRY